MQKGAINNLRVKMMLVIVLTVLVCIGLMLLFSYQRARVSMSAQLEANYSVVADKYAQELASWINTKATILDTMAAEITYSKIYRIAKIRIYAKHIAHIFVALDAPLP